jgi:hypothetical protein
MVGNIEVQNTSVTDSLIAASSTSKITICAFIHGLFFVIHK